LSNSRNNSRINSRKNSRHSRENTNSRSITRSVKDSKIISHEKHVLQHNNKLSISSNTHDHRRNQDEKAVCGQVTGILQNTKNNNKYKRKQSTTSQVTIQSPNNNLQTSIGYTDMLSAFSGHGCIESNDKVSQHDFQNSRLSQCPPDQFNNSKFASPNVFDASHASAANQYMVERIRDMENMIKSRHAPPPAFNEHSLATDPDVGLDQNNGWRNMARAPDQ